MNLTDEKKELIEDYLLEAMKSLDRVNAILWDANENINDTQQLSLIKGRIKTILNRSYDTCARDADKPYKGKTLKEHLSGASTCCCDTGCVCNVHDQYIKEQS